MFPLSHRRCRSGYDHVLLYGYLVPLLFESGLKPRIERRGNKITAISTCHGVAFRDVTKLLAPSTNLRKFGELFGLEQKKAHFPFSLLRSVEDLKRPGLPASASDPAWKSDLDFPGGGGGEGSSGGGDDGLTESEYAEAVGLFEQAGCRNLGDYLAAYLKLDVDILYRASQAWRRQLYQLTGVDFIESRKYTISSLSYTAGLKVWERNKRIGTFFPNNSQHYRILRRGMRG